MAAITLAGEMARNVQIAYSGPNLPALWWARLPVAFLTMFLVLWGIGALGYGVLFVLRRTGAQRFTNIDTSAEQR